MQNCIDGCLLTGSVPSCDQECLEEEDHFGLHTDISICQGKHCADDCGRQCGGFLHRVEGCADCVQNNCCDLAIDCANDEDCLYAIRCRTTCATGDWGCYRDCSPQSDAGIWEGEFEQCVARECPSACGLGSAWKCVEKNQRIEFDPRKITLSWQFHAIQGKEIADVSVKMCNDADCAEPLVEGFSGPDGIVRLTYEIQVLGMSWAYFWISKEGFLDLFMRVSYPLSDSPGLINAKMVTEKDLEVFSGLDEIESDKGHLFVSIFDCVWNSAPNLTISAVNVPEAKPYYTKNWVPRQDAYATSLDGQAGFFNLPPTQVRLNVDLLGREESPLLEYLVEIRPHSLTYLILWPL